MTYDEVKALAHRVGFDTENETGMTCLELFAIDVAKTEREACAKLCETHVDEYTNTFPPAGHYKRDMDCHECASAIRMRSNVELTGAARHERETKP
jgi:hypothetical protein